jgi:hypothetical protein
LHAIFVCGVWILTFKFDLDVMPGKLWMATALIWPFWVGAAIASRPEYRVRWAVAVAIGMLLLTPTIPTLYTFVVWSIEGFAP